MRSIARLSFVRICSSLVAIVIGNAIALAQNPSDACVLAPTVTVGAYAFNNATANPAAVSADMPCGLSVSRDVWAKFVAPEAGTLTIDTCSNPSFPTVLALHSACGSLPLVCDHDDCPNGGARLSRLLSAGQTVLVRIASGANPSASGSGTLNVGFVAAPPPPPANDECGALGIPVLSVGLTAFDTTEASNSTTEPQGVYQDLWFRYTAPSDGTGGTLTVDTCTSTTFSSVLVGYTTEYGCNSPPSNRKIGESICDMGSRLSHRLSPGQSYIIRVGGVDPTQFGPGMLNVMFAPSINSNEDCAHALTIGLGTVTFDNTEAIDAAGFIDTQYNDTRRLLRDLWYRFTAPEDGLYRFDTCQDPGFYRSQVFLFAPDCGSGGSSSPRQALRLVDRTHPHCLPLERHGVVRRLAAGETVEIAVGSDTNDVGSYGVGTLNIEQVPPPALSDTCETAPTLAAGTYFVSSRDIPFLPDGGVPGFCIPDTQGQATRVLWCRYTAPTTGHAFFHTFLGTGDREHHFVGVYDECDGEIIACARSAPVLGDVSGTEADVPLVAGQSVLVFVADNTSFPTSTIALTIVDPVAPPSNDECEGAILLTEGSWTFDNTAASVSEPVSPGGWCTSGDGFNSPSVFSRDLWYRYVAPSDGVVGISTCGSEFLFNTVLAVYDGCGPIGGVGNILACNDGQNFVDECGYLGCNARTAVQVSAGQQIVIRVGGSHAGHASTIGVLNITHAPTILNDDCADAIDVAAGSYNFSTTLATTDAPIVDIRGCSRGVGHDIWYRYTAPSTGTVVFDTLPSAFDPALRAYDACGGLLLGCNDDGFGFNSGVNSRMVLRLNAGQSVLICITGYFGSSGDGALSISGPFTPPTNDTCQGAMAVRDGDRVEFDLRFAGADPGQYDCWFYNNDVTIFTGDAWYKYTNPTDTTRTVSLDYDFCTPHEPELWSVMMQAYSGGCDGPNDCVSNVHGETTRCASHGGLVAGYPTSVGPHQTIWLRVVGGLGTGSAAFVVRGDPPLPPCLGDFNGDGFVDLTDLIAFNVEWQPNIGLSVEPGTNGDRNSDGFVDLSDLIAFNIDWQPMIGLSCP